MGSEMCIRDRVKYSVKKNEIQSSPAPWPGVEHIMLHGIGSPASTERRKSSCSLSLPRVKKKKKMSTVNRIGKAEGEERYEMEG